MKTKMSKVFTIACLLVCTVVGVQAQPASWDNKYPKVEGGNTIVSRDAAGGIKSEALLTTAEKNWLNTTNSSTTIYNDKSEYNKVSAKFQVASTDASTGTGWADAFTKCNSYSQTGAAAGSWRLPTQRELMLMWMFKAKLTSCGNITTASGHFWSSTEYSGNTSGAWVVNISYGNPGSYVKDKYNYYVRCVRDL